MRNAATPLSRDAKPTPVIEMSKLVSFFQYSVETPARDTPAKAKVEAPAAPTKPPGAVLPRKLDAVPPRKEFGKRRPVDPDLDKKLGKILAKKSGELIANRFQMVGLEKILDRLGNDDTAEQVYSIAEKILQAHVSEEDVVEPHELLFLVCFANLDRQQAADEAKQIEADIQEQILGEGLDPEISDIATETRTVKVSEADISGSDNLLGLIAEKIARETDRVKKGLKHWSSKYIAICEIRPSPVVTKAQDCAGFQIAYSQRTRADIGQLVEIGADTVEVAAEADCMMVRRVSELVFQGDRNKDPLMIVDVHYSTLSDKSFREKFFSACRPISEVCANSLIVRILYSLENPPNLRFSGLVNKLGSLFQSRIMHIEKPRIGRVDFRACRIPIISMNYRELEPAMNQFKLEIQKFIDTVHSNRTRLLIDDVSNQKAANDLFDLGTDFVSFRGTESPRKVSLTPA